MSRALLSRLQRSLPLLSAVFDFSRSPFGAPSLAVISPRSLWTLHNSPPRSQPPTASAPLLWQLCSFHGRLNRRAANCTNASCVSGPAFRQPSSTGASSHTLWRQTFRFWRFEFSSIFAASFRATVRGTRRSKSNEIGWCADSTICGVGVRPSHPPLGGYPPKGGYLHTLLINLLTRMPGRI